MRYDFEKLQCCPPVAIGGIGGSGTRLIAAILHELDFFIGSDLNTQRDNLWFTLLFKHVEIIGAEQEDFESRPNVRTAREWAD